MYTLYYTLGMPGYNIRSSFGVLVNGDIKYSVNVNCVQNDTAIQNVFFFFFFH